MKRGFIRLMIGSMIAAFAATSSVAVAQNVDFAEKQQAQLRAGSAKEHKKTERKTIEQEEGAGPKVAYETDEMAAAAAAAEKIELQQQAIKKLQIRIKQTDDDDPAKPELMERMGDMLWQKARFYELRSYEYLAQANEALDAGDKAKAEDLKAKKAADEKTARESRDEMLKLYKDIIKYHNDYPQLDKIRYYMAFNLAEMGYAGEAYEQYSGIVREHSNSKYLPEAFLGMAEYTFAIDENMEEALKQYKKVESIDPSSSAASYAMYKEGWCYFNLGQPKLALAQFEKVIREADKSNNPRKSNMRKEAMKDLVKAYSMWDDAKPANARKYFKGFAKDDEEVNTMMERLARFYQENGRIDDSNFVYNQLIAANPKKFKVVDYQYEIMLNVETLSDPERLAAEIDRTVQLFVLARDQKYEGATPEAVKKTNDTLESYVSDTAKWYHMTYQNTKNPLYYSLAYEIYGTYLNNFPNADDNFEVMYYYADMAYFRKNYADAAKGYERVLDLNDKGKVPKSEDNDKILKDSAHGAVLAYDQLMGESNTDKEACPDIPKTPEAKDGEEQTYPEYPIAECRLKFIEASKRYAKIDTSAEFAANSKYKSALIYYDYNHFDEAVPLFRDVVRDAPGTDAAVYSANYILEIYKLKKQYSDMAVAINEFKGNSTFMANNTEHAGDLRTAMSEYEEALDYKFCVEKEEKKQWEEAARCFEKYAEAHNGSKEAAEARWNASADWERGQNIARAIEARVALLQSSETDPNAAELAPRALYAIGLNFHGLAVYSEAARYYELFVKKYPDDKTACLPVGQQPAKNADPCAKDALSNAAAFRAGLGEYEKAVENYDLYAKMFPKDKGEMSGLKFATGRIYYDQKNYDKALDRFNDFLRNYAKYGSADRQIAAYTYIGKIYTHRKNVKEALKNFEKAESIFNDKGTQKWLGSADAASAALARDSAAEARFLRGEVLFKEALDIKLYDSSVKPSQINKSLQTQMLKKSEKMNEAVPVYNEVITKYKSPKWGLAALTRLGMMYHDVGHQITYAPTPPNLPEEVQIEYELQLVDFANAFEDKAVGYYVDAVTRAADTGFFSQYTTEAQKRLFELRPDEYRSAAEVKATPNQMVPTYQSSALFTDLDLLRGKAVKEHRQHVVDTTAEEAAAPAGGEQAE